MQPMTQAKTAIHRETAVAIPALMVWSVARISRLVYALSAKTVALVSGVKQICSWECAKLNSCDGVRWGIVRA